MLKGLAFELRLYLSASWPHRVLSDALVAGTIIDGVPNSRSYPQGLSPDVELTDFPHAAKRLNVAEKAACGDDGDGWFERRWHVLRYEPDGIGKVIGVIRYRANQASDSADLRRELDFFRKNRHRMRNYEAVVAANRTLVSVRMKRSG